MSAVSEGTASRKPAIAPTVYTVAQVAQRWECSESHVRNMIEDGELPHFRLGKLIRIKKEDVEKWESSASANTNSEDSATSGALPGAKMEESGAVSDLGKARQTRREASLLRS